MADTPIAAGLPLWLELNKVSRQCMEALAARLSHIGINRHFSRWRRSARAGGLTQREPADLLETDKVSMVGILHALSKKGFVRRTPSRENGSKQMNRRLSRSLRLF